jgi:tetratricopeptide (TPR) repeat protein
MRAAMDKKRTGPKVAVRVFTVAFVGALAAAVLLPGCAPAAKPAGEQAPQPSQPDRFVTPGDFSRALDPILEARRANPKDRALAARCVRTVESIKQTADRALAAKDYEMAQAAFRVLKKNYDAFQDLASRLTFSRADVEAGLKYASIYSADARYLRALEAVDYPRALEVYRVLLSEYPADAVVRGKCATAAREVWNAGNKALRAKDYARAGVAHALLLRNLASFERLGPELGFTRADLTKTVADCRGKLMTSGLAEYRKGNVTRAVAIWQSLLAFDPDNAEAKKALETAKIQMREAEKKK